MKTDIFQQFQEVNFQGAITSEIHAEKFRKDDKELVLIAAPAEVNYFIIFVYLTFKL